MYSVFHLEARSENASEKEVWPRLEAQVGVSQVDEEKKGILGK